MVSSAAWSEEQNLSCNLFSSGFDRRVLGWSVNVFPKTESAKM